MNLDVAVFDQASPLMRAIWSEQLPFATARSINRTAQDFQGVQRAHEHDIFEVRRDQFIDRSTKIKPFANKRSLQARVMVEPPGGQKRADILTKFEHDVEKVPFRGTRIAIPTSNVPRTAGVIQRRWRPRRLNLKPMRGKSKNVLRGDLHTFAILRSGGRGLIFERDIDELVLLYVLKPRVPIKPELNFETNARRTVTDRWALNFDAAFMAAQRSARNGGAGFGALTSALAALAG